jgi:hypothetical protein
MLATGAGLVACGGGSSPAPAGAAPGAPGTVAATLDATGSSVVVTFTAPADPGGSAVTGYTVTSAPAGLSAAGSGLSITAACPVSCAGFAVSVAAANAAGAGPPSAPVHVVTGYEVVATFREPMTQPNDTIFTGTFTLDSTTRTVSNLAGTLTESMTPPPDPMTTVSLTHQLSAVPDGLGGHGQLVTTFLLDTLDTFYPGGFDPHDANAIHYGFPAAWVATTANAYAMIDVDTDHPTAAPAQAVVDKLAYADCTAGGMMGPVCMTGTTKAGYGHVGSMSGYPVSQVVTRR